MKHYRGRERERERKNKKTTRRISVSPISKIIKSISITVEVLMFSSWCSWFEMLSHSISMGWHFYTKVDLCRTCARFHEISIEITLWMFARLPETAVNGALIFVGLKAALGTQLWEPWHSIAFDQALHT